MTVELTITSLTDRGRVREQNEDSLLDDATPLVAIADGMGGHQAGEVASSMALQVLRSWKAKLDEASPTDVGKHLRDAFNEANKAVFEHGQTDDALEGMGTTLTAGWISGNTLTIGHVGDSRAYLLRSGKLQQLTEDQNVAQDLVRKGRLSAAEAASSPHRHLVLQAIGVEYPKNLDVDITSVELRPGDRLLFASDGMFGMVRDPEVIRAALADNTDPKDACRVLVDLANAAGGEDNISVLLVDVAGDAEAADDEPVVIEKPDASGAPTKAPAPRRGIPRSILIGAGAVLVVAIAVAAFSLRPTGPSYVVSAREGKVVVLDGDVGKDGHPAQGQVVRVFHQSVDKFPATTRADLRKGFAVASIEAGELLVRRLPRLLGPQDTPPPSPEGSPSPTAPSTLPPKSP